VFQLAESQGWNLIRSKVLGTAKKCVFLPVNFDLRFVAIVVVQSAIKEK